MNDIPRQKLKELIMRFGTSLSEDRLRCLGMLKDLCGEQKKEIAGIMAALEEKRLCCMNIQGQGAPFSSVN